jgi:hypothetical protein
MLLLVVLATAPAWTVTLTTDATVDHGDGKNRGVETRKIVVRSADKGEARNAIAALLPEVPAQPATYSISDFVDDEGSYSERLTVEREGKSVTFHLIQGKRAPLLPKLLADIRARLPAPK